MKNQGKTGIKSKGEIKTVAEKNRIVNTIRDTILERDTFLLLGHKDPDTDCIASLVAFALLLNKFNKEVTIYLASAVMAQFSYLLAICKYNGISVVYGKLGSVKSFSSVIILDTPKPDMIARNDEIISLMDDPRICKIEIDHHLAADSEYAGDSGCCLVDEASSTCELIGYLLLKLSYQKERFTKIDFFTRNLALAVLTGIVGDSQMGRYLKTSREKFYYRIFSEIFDQLLVEKTDKNSKNLSSMEAVFDVIQNFSVQEKHCFDGIMALKNTSRSIHYICMDREKSAEFFKTYEVELIINVSKAAADTLAEDCGKLGLVVYYDDPSLSGFVQFRLRRSAKFLHTDLRTVLTGLNIENGGGHPGAIGFRVKKEDIQDIEAYTMDIVKQIEALVEDPAA
ncbi:MAG: DHH family phosphoesterase [Spirochaetaceae bacterium]|jgi:nanoRNase/pAp phosphatase (c-di-AMP/oligoRNAs hydrolase)|nr:DHH family phosphoesterase [Spirochaetaceae bacterium]